MDDYEYVSMDNARKIYIPSTLENEFKGKRYIVIPMPNGDVILHPIETSENPLKELRKIFKNEKRPIKQIKKEILETAIEGV